MDKNLLKARALYYAFFSELLNFLDDEKVFQSIEEKLQIISQSPINEDAQRAIDGMSEFLKRGFNDLKEEQNDIFYSPVTSFVPVSASYYDEARDDGKKRLEMIGYIKEAGFLKDESYIESEDHVSFIFGFLSTLLSEPNSQNIELSKKVFKNVIDGFIDEFIFKLHSHEKGDFYKHLAVLMDVFFKVERL